MFDCPYCHNVFTTKQRLISHLTRNNKCYDNSIGVPPILMELIGFSNDDKNKTSEEPVVSEPANNTSISVICSGCSKKFISQKNLDRHITTGKCHGSSTSNSKVITQTLDMNIPVIYKSKKETEIKIKKKEKVKEKEKEVVIVPEQRTHVKYIEKEDYVSYLTQQLGTTEQAFKFIRNCIQSKLRGCINLLYKIYFENKVYLDYPIEIVDIKTHKVYYKTDSNIILDENCNHIKSVMIDNIRNCYLQFCNNIINSNLDDNHVLFDDYDIGDIQSHILELSDEKKKDRVISGLLDQIKK